MTRPGMSIPVTVAVMVTVCESDPAGIFVAPSAQATGAKQRPATATKIPIRPASISYSLVRCGPVRRVPHRRKHWSRPLQTGGHGGATYHGDVEVLMEGRLTDRARASRRDD